MMHSQVMGVNRLYIIGNGFDLFHEIASEYRHFATYLYKANPSVFRMVGEYFSADLPFWADFEQRLAEFDADQAVDYASQFLDEKGYDDFQYELEKIASGLSYVLRGHFSDWIRSLKIPSRSTIAHPLIIDPTSLFLNFNYTPTLEEVYDVPRGRILHIHGSAAEPAEELVFGHGWERRPEDSLNFKPEGPDDDWRVREGIEHIDDYFAATFKPTAALINSNSAFFGSLSDIREVSIMGHGLAEVDEPYIEAIMDQVDLQKTQWTISVYDDREERKRLFGAYDIASHLVQYRLLSQFD
ncbi:bacteriophage abortive infection AbiH family protein [Parasphingorhabdus sp.]|uniref:bacteriophage abortive infection AbiH family protein n=1 Tax=Parasphingorhabdus sp. TaxID=2709688 RepID=UPI003264F80A